MGLFNHKDEKKTQNGPPPPINQAPSSAAPDAPPSYDQSQQIHTDSGQIPQYANDTYGSNEYPPEKQYTPNGYPEEKKGEGSSYGQPPSQPPPQQGQFYNAPPQPQDQGSRWEAPGWGGNQAPPQAYQQGNAQPPPNVYEVKPRTANIAMDNGKYTRPEYQQYKARDQERMAYGDFPKPREAFKHGAPLEPGHKAQGKSSGGFPGSSGATYYSSANR